VGGLEDFHGIAAGAYVSIHVERVPVAAAAAFVERVAASLQVCAPLSSMFCMKRQGPWNPDFG
jgi:hypothetical protein